MTESELEESFDNVYASIYRIKHELDYINKQLNGIDSTGSDLVKMANMLDAFLYKLQEEIEDKKEEITKESVNK